MPTTPNTASSRYTGLYTLAVFPDTYSTPHETRPGSFYIELFYQP